MYYSPYFESHPGTLDKLFLSGRGLNVCWLSLDRDWGACGRYIPHVVLGDAIVMYILSVTSQRVVLVPPAILGNSPFS